MQHIDINSEKSFREVFGTFYVPLVHYANTFLHNSEDAEDIVQEVFVTVWERTAISSTGNGLKSYLYRSVKNRCLNFLRDSSVKKKKMSELPEDEVVDFQFSHEIIREEVYQQLLATFDTLPPQCKKIYQLSLAGMKASEIASELNLSVETVKTQKKRAKSLLVQRFVRFAYLLIPGLLKF